MDVFIQDTFIVVIKDMMPTLVTPQQGNNFINHIFGNSRPIHIRHT
jgi:hypothetical protein